MPSTATVTVDLDKIRDNAQRVVDFLPEVEIFGVTKVTAGSPEVARAMLDGGVAGIAESRIENAIGLRQAGIDAPIMLLRAPVPALAAEAVKWTDLALVSELDIVAALDEAAAEADRPYGIIAMVDVGDLREGMMPEELPAFLEAAARFEHVEVSGIGISLTCYGAIVPTADNLGLLVHLAEAAEDQLGRELVVSGGMSTSLDTAIAGALPERVDNLRVGEAIVLGVSPASRENILGLHTDAVTLSAPVIECKVKPSKPIGISAQDAFGGTPTWEDRGLRRRAICAIGRQDVVPGDITPRAEGAEVLGGSSDHLIVDVEDMAQPPAIGDSLVFVPGYSATLALFTSPYVRKRFISR